MNYSKFSKSTKGMYPCLRCHVVGLRFKENPCNKCKREIRSQNSTTNIKEEDRGADEAIGLGDANNHVRQDEAPSYLPEE